MSRRVFLLFAFLYLITRSALAQFLSQDTIFISDTIVSLSDITVTAQKNVIKKADKIIYKVNEKDFIHHTKADNVLKRIPNVAVTSSGIMIDNYKNAVIYIDGIESNEEELKHINVEDIESVEVINNPSAIYGSELTGGVINVIRKKKEERFFMGELEGSKSVRLNRYSFSPSFSFKTHKITTKAFYSFTKNNQNIHTLTERFQKDSMYSQDNRQKVRGWQSYASLSMRVDFNPSNQLFLSGSAMYYKFDHQYNGELRTDVGATPLDYANREWLGKYSANLLYRHLFSGNALLDIKAKYFDYSTEYRSQMDKYSKIREGTGEILYQKRAINLWENPLDLTFGYKSIYREYYTGKNKKWLSSQAVNLFNASANYSLGNVSGYASLSYDYMHQKLGGAAIDKHSFLPVVSILYNNPRLVDLSANYSRKITRPSIDYLNPEAETFSPLYIRVGNTGLDTQLNNELSFRVSKNLPKQHNLSLNAYYIFNNKVIGEVIRESGNNTIYSYDNIGKMRVGGFSMGWFAPLPYEIYLNAQVGPSYREYSSPGSQSLVRENGGWSFMTYLIIGAKIKDFLSVNLDYSHNSRVYQLVSTTKMRPMVNLNIETNLLKDKLKIALYCMDLGGWFTTSHSVIHGDSFEQYVVNENKMMNFSVSVRYLFGKKFKDSFGGRTIDNSDIITK